VVNSGHAQLSQSFQPSRQAGGQIAAMSGVPQSTAITDIGKPSRQ
jgi:hypothetical protein